MSTTKATWTERFWAKVEKFVGPNACWVWTGARYSNGYGLGRGLDGRNHTAQRLSWELHNGPIPDGMLVCHRCDNRPCVRPDHLFLGDYLINSHDMMAKGRHWMQQHPDQPNPGRRPSRSLEDRFLAKVHQTDTCWLWTGSCDGKGYGMLGLGDAENHILRAHRVSWMLYRGEIPDGLQVFQTCGNRACVCPEHLSLGTTADHAQRIIQSGHHISQQHPERMARGEQTNHTKLTAADVIAIRESYAEGASVAALVLLYGVTDSTIQRAVNRQNWQHLP